LCYVTLEYALFRVALPYLPVDVRMHLPDIVDVLAQNSKAGYLPHDYVALLGDSYAEGLGDWLLQQGGDRRGRQGIPFLDATPALRAAASANVIHGPRDWDHLNEIGYRVLGSQVAARVRSFN
jgi:hypothetical protein